MRRLLLPAVGLFALALTLPLVGAAQPNDSLNGISVPPGEELPGSAIPTATDTTEKDAPFVATDQRVVE